MPCFSPLTGWLSRSVNPSGKRSIVFDRSVALVHRPVSVACGQCIGCRLERSRQMALRCEKEASLYDRNCFITLTYAPKFLPLVSGVPTLVKSDAQKFMKRLRFRFGAGIRFILCGEYGDRGERPHYHACLFNFDFMDKVEKRITELGHKVYTSPSLGELWPFGIHEVGSFSFETAAYVARYICKKVSGERASSHYGIVDEATGEVLSDGRVPEFVLVSRRPGLGKPWFDKFRRDVFPHDFVVSRGRMLRPPKYFTSALEVDDKETYEGVIKKRKAHALKGADNNSVFRLKDRERIQEQKAKLLKRGYENA